MGQTAGAAKYSGHMEIARERFLDQSRDYHLTLALRSRTTAMHSALTALTADERAAVAASLSRALDEIAAVVSRRVPSQTG
jgi:hypothetical protein